MGIPMSITNNVGVMCFGKLDCLPAIGGFRDAVSPASRSISRPQAGERRMAWSSRSRCEMASLLDAP